jgi:sugar lactone lactonase YvrE
MKRLLFIIVLLPLLGSAQIISTFAGGGTMLGDGGAATSAKVLNPNGGSFDRFGNYYVASNNGHRIRRVDTAGIITTVAGNGTSGYSGDGGSAMLAQLKNPEAAIVDTNGNIYIADAGNSRIRKVDAMTGIITTIAGTSTSGFGGDNGPATSAMLADPLDICMDKDGNIYIADYGNARIRKVNALTGIITTIAGNGVASYSGDGSKADTSAIGGIQGICIDAWGNLFLASVSESRVIKLDTSGFLSTTAGTGIGYLYNGDSIAANTAQVNPVKVAVDDTGNVYIAEYHNFRVRKVDTFGIIHTIAGGGIQGFSGDGGFADTAKFDYPAGLTFDKCGNLYIADVGNNRVRKVTYDSTCSYSSPVDTVDTTTYVHNVTSLGSISIYPNPAKEQLTVSAGTIATEVMIVNAIGQVLLRQPYGGSKSSINISSLPPGLYYLLVTEQKTGRTERLKFLKE